MLSGRWISTREEEGTAEAAKERERERERERKRVDGA